jgi:hypothetical protein
VKGHSPRRLGVLPSSVRRRQGEHSAPRRKSQAVSCGFCLGLPPFCPSAIHDGQLPAAHREKEREITMKPERCINGHEIRSSQDRTSNRTCRVCQRDRNRAYAAGIRADARRMRQLQALLIAS